MIGRLDFSLSTTSTVGTRTLDADALLILDVIPEPVRLNMLEYEIIYSSRSESVPSSSLVSCSAELLTMYDD